MQVVDLLLQRQAQARALFMSTRWFGGRSSSPFGRFLLLQVNRRNSRGFTALHAAAENGHVSVMCRGFDVSEARTAGCCEDLKFEQSNHRDCLLACVV